MSQLPVEDVQAVIEALTDAERWVWVFSAQYDNDDSHQAFFSTCEKAVVDALLFIRTAVESTKIDTEMHDELALELSAPGMGGISAAIDGILYLDIYCEEVH